MLAIVGGNGSKAMTRKGIGMFTIKHIICPSFPCFQTTPSKQYQSMSQPFPEADREHEPLTHSPKELEGDLARRFQFLGTIGEGTFGMVSSVYDKEKRMKVALKKIKLSRKHQGLPASSLREVVLLKSIKHPNIVKIEDIFYDCDAPHFSFTLELLPHNLHDILRQNTQLTLKRIKKYTFQMFSALQYLHRRGIVHRDLKPQNLLVDAEETLKLCDFGQAKLTLFGEHQHTPDISTLWYRAPEVLLGSLEYDEGVDVWAAGCIVTQMILGKPLFRGNSQLAMINSIFQLMGTPRHSEYPQIVKMQYYSPSYPKYQPSLFSFEGIPREGEDFLKRALVVNPSKRITVEQALRHEFLADEAEK